ncbi:dnaJ homolog subfamily B member 13-like [Coccinella septempunctata]|uniref:dnaJ homolog subfamily B member 13-like n=1 Tax=Coccinella septempunctata TaxID=41139 RepID=UPI001D060C3C|nr:dnaJ homolog subfamily B member 13-like [Coccinella septempunctata]
MGIDYYGILQIPRTSTSLDIKKAYRGLALEFHPERLKQPNAKEVFSLICEAYDVLGDPYRRAIFDQYGEEGLKAGVPTKDEFIHPYHYHGDPLLTYREFFGTDSPYADLLDYLKNPPAIYETSENKAVKEKKPPIKHPLVLSLHEIFFGGVKKMKIHRLTFVDEKQTRTEVTEKILSIPIKPGMRPGTEIVFFEEGDQHPAYEPADVIFITEDKEHETFIRDGNDLVMVVEITLEEALLGTTVTVNTIDHRTIRVPITDVIDNDYEKIVEGEGMPILEKYPEKGDLRIRFKICFPTYLPKASRELLSKGFHLAKLGGGCRQHETINKLVLADKMFRVGPEERLPPV